MQLNQSTLRQFQAVILSTSFAVAGFYLLPEAVLSANPGPHAEPEWASHSRKAGAYFRDSAWQSAQVEYQTAINLVGAETDPNVILDLRINRGAALANAGKYSEALKEYAIVERELKAISVNRNVLELRLHRRKGEAFKGQGKFGAAVEEQRQAVDLIEKQFGNQSTSYIEGLHILETLLLQEGRLDEAAKVWQTMEDSGLATNKQLQSSQRAWQAEKIDYIKVAVKHLCSTGNIVQAVDLLLSIGPKLDAHDAVWLWNLVYQHLAHLRGDQHKLAEMASRHLLQAGKKLPAGKYPLEHALYINCLVSTFWERWKQNQIDAETRSMGEEVLRKSPHLGLIERIQLQTTVAYIYATEGKLKEAEQQIDELAVPKNSLRKQDDLNGFVQCRYALARAYEKLGRHQDAIRQLDKLKQLVVSQNRIPDRRGLIQAWTENILKTN